MDSKINLDLTFGMDRITSFLYNREIKKIKDLYNKVQIKFQKEE